MTNIDDWQDLFKIGDEEKIKSLLRTKRLTLTGLVASETPLHVAIFNGHENIVKLLLRENKRLLFIKNEYGCTPLHTAVYTGNVSMIEILLQNGAPLNCHDMMRKQCPLLIAVSENLPKIVTSLVSRDNINLHCSVCNLNIFHVAIARNLKPIIQILLKHANVFDICSCPYYPDPEFAEELFHRCLEKRSARDIVTGKRKRKYKSPLHFAAYYGRIHQVKTLIESKARVNARSYGNEMHDGKTPLHEAVLGQDGQDFETSLKMMEILLKNGASDSVNIFDNNGKTPLHYAVMEEQFRPEKIQLLLNYKANVNAHNPPENKTPIFYVKCTAVLQMLIDNGADVNFMMTLHYSMDPSKNYSRTPLQYAIMENDSRKVDLLLKNGAEVNFPNPNIMFYESLFGAKPEILQAIIDRMPDITAVVTTIVSKTRDNRNIIPILVKRHFQGEVTLNSEEFSSTSGIFFSRFKECQEELERMRDVSVLNLSLFDILTMSMEKLKSYVRKEEVLKVFEAYGTIRDRFPVYAGMMIRRFRQAKEERDLIDSSSEALRKFIFSLHKIHLPDLVVYEIIDFLHIVDLKNLAEI